jgi:uncharacterized protein Veg
MKIRLEMQAISEEQKLEEQYFSVFILQVNNSEASFLSSSWLIISVV